MNFTFLVGMLPDFATATLVTLGISATSALVGLLLGFAMHTLYLFFPLIWTPVYQVYIWVFRGVPFLVQLFLMYYGLPVLGFTPSAVEASILALGLYSSAYFAEIFRAAWNTLAKGQSEAALSLGISIRKTFLYIQSPQAIRFAVPLIFNQILLVIKESALTSIITVPELTMTAGRIVAENFAFIEPYLILALMYWLLTYLTTRIGKFIEHSYHY